MKVNILVPVTLLVALAGASYGTAHAKTAAGGPAACAGIKALSLDHTRVVSARFDPGGRQSYQSPRGSFGGNLRVTFELPPSCRVKLLLTPAPGSHIEAELWMPARGSWNGRLWSNGNGGLGGPIDPANMLRALSGGYATSANDTGHRGNGLDGSWARGHFQRLIDYAYRADHVTAVQSKTIIKRFYRRAVAYSYFAGGSDGGREALMEAQRYPEDYDGIEAGAPPFDGANTVLYWSWLEQQFEKPGARIPPDKLPAIAAAAMSACDARDGLKDGLIEGPRSCHVDPAKLLCHGADTNECLTAAQVQSLKDIYDGPGGSDPAGYHYYGYEPGSELNWRDWVSSDSAAQSLSRYFALQFQRYFMRAGPGWTFERFNLKREAPEDFRRMERVYEALNPDLSRFAAHGGKLIIFHGWADQALQPQLSVAYYERVRAVMGARKARTFLALYMVPGMAHVMGGRGPNTFGQIVAPPPHATAGTNIGAALERWVEKGVAPGAIVAGEYDNSLEALYVTRGSKPIRTLPICPYPAVARYRGTGDVNDAVNFKCSAVH